MELVRLGQLCLVKLTYEAICSIWSDHIPRRGDRILGLYIHQHRKVHQSASDADSDRTVKPTRVTQSGVSDKNVKLKADSIDHIVARMAEIKATGANREQQNVKLAMMPESVLSRLNETPPKRSSEEFIAALRDAVAKGDAGVIDLVLEQVPNSEDCIGTLKSLVAAQTSGVELRRYAAEALVRSGSKEGVEFVVDQILAARQSGDTSLAETLLYSLVAPTSVEGARALFDLLLGTGRYAGNTTDLPEDLRATVRKAIRLAPDQEAVGDLAAQYYLDPQISWRNEALLELFDGVAQPAMLSSLAVRAYQAGSPENAGHFLDRLVQSGDPGVVRAFVQAASQEPALLSAAAEKLYAWTLSHKQQAQLGLFIEYLTDSTRPAVQRIVAAFGVAGIEDAQEANRALNKTLTVETDPEVRATLTLLLGFLQQGE